MEVLVLDNYDSFTYNLIDSLRSLGVLDIVVMTNDQIQWELVNNCKKILVSPGPGTPEEAGDLLKLIRRYHQSKSILGICLGHQAIAQVFGGQLINLQNPRHGQTASVNLSTTDPLFKGIPKKIKGGLYHSWSVDPTNLPEDLQVIALSGDRIMGIRHAHYDVVGVQFHPESYATPYGVEILRNWL